MRNYIDLHVHSTASDGTYTPQELVAYAEEKNLYAFALTDHDSIDGLSAAFAAKKTLCADVAIIPGVELSCAYAIDGISFDVHIVGLNVDYQNPAFQSALNTCKQIREARNAKMIKKMNENGFPITQAEMTEKYGGATITRAHYARYLLENGFVKTKEEAFERYLNPGCPCYVPRKLLTPKEGISLILSAGGHPILAHPMLYTKINRTQLEHLVSELKSYGLEGIEVYYSTYTEEETAYVKQLSEKYGLFPSGGSDFHGSNKPDIDLMTGRGNLRISKEIINSI
jgi:predicted metal-dependent phosphoesterase TrpH